MITVLYTQGHIGQTVTYALGDVDTTDLDDEKAGHQMNLEVGDNAVNVKVLAEDGETKNPYTVNIRRRSEDADLSALAFSGISSISQNFDSGTLAYSASVLSTIMATTVTFTTNHESATAEVTLESQTSTSSGSPFTLQAGPNDFSIEVTAENGNTKTYTVNIFQISGNASLRDLDVIPATVGCTLDPTFASSILSYGCDVKYGVTELTISATPDEAGIGLTIKKGATQLATRSHNGTSGVSLTGSTSSLSVGDNTFTVETVSPDGTGMLTYTVIVRRLNNNANLRDLVLSKGYFDCLHLLDDPNYQCLRSKDSDNANEFDPATTSYSVFAENSQTSTELDVGLQDRNASYQVTKPSGLSINQYGGYQLELPEGVTQIEIVVTPEDVTQPQKTYTISVTRAPIVSIRACEKKADTEDRDGDLDTTELVDFCVGEIIEGEEAVYTVSRSVATDASLSVSLAVSETGETPEDEFGEVYSGGTTKTVTIPANQTEAILRLSTDDDTIWEKHSRLKVTVTPSDHAVSSRYAVGRDDSASILIKNNDAPASTLGIAVGSGVTTAVPEDVGNVSVTVTLTTNGNRQPNADISFQLETLDGTAVKVLDFTDSTGEYIIYASSFNPNNAGTRYEAAYTVNVPIIDDAIFEGRTDETFTVRLKTTGQATNVVSTGITSYIVKIEDNDPSTIATLSALSVSNSGSAIALTPAFASGVKNYQNLTVANNVTFVQVSATTADAEAQITFPPSTNTFKHQVTAREYALDVGENFIEIKVTAEDTDYTETYTVKLNRMSNDATLASLVLSEIDIGAFDPADEDYTANTPYARLLTTVTAVPNHSKTKSVVTTPMDSDSMSDGHQVSLGIGDTTVRVVVTAEDGTTKTYEVVVTRDPLEVFIEATILCNGANPVDYDESDTSWVPTCIEGQSITFKLITSEVTSTDLSVNVGIEDPGDFIAAENVKTHVVTISANHATGTLVVPTVNDGAWEEHNTVVATVKDSTSLVGTKPSYFPIGSPADIIVKDNDNPEIDVALKSLVDPIPEDAGTVTFQMIATTKRDESPVGHNENRFAVLYFLCGVITGPNDPCNLWDGDVPYVGPRLEGTASLGSSGDFDYNSHTRYRFYHTSTFQRVDIDESSDAEDYRWRSVIDFPIPIKDDDVWEQNEDFAVFVVSIHDRVFKGTDKYGNPTTAVGQNVGFTNNKANAYRINLIDDDFPSSTIEIKVPNETLENASPATATITIETDNFEDPHDARSLLLNTFDGTAVAPDDYTGIEDFALDFLPGDFVANSDSSAYVATKTVDVAIIDDEEYEDLRETFDVDLAAAVSPEDTVRMTYTAPDSNALQDSDGNDAATRNRRLVINNTGIDKPILQLAIVDGSSLDLTYDEGLDQSSQPAASDFAVTVNSGAVAVSSVSISGKAVTLTLGTAVIAGDGVFVSYTPATNPVQDSDGNDADSFMTQSVLNVTGVTGDPELLVGAVKRMSLVLTYNEVLDDTSTPATAAYSVNVDGDTVTVDSVSVSGRTVTLLLSAEDTILEPTLFDSGISKKPVTIRDDEANKDADLGALVVKDHIDGLLTLDPDPFVKETTSYTVSVPYAVSFVTLEWTSNHGESTTVLNRGDSDAAKAGSQVALAQGLNGLTVTVTAPDTTTKKTYTVAVTRRSPPVVRMIAPTDTGKVEGEILSFEYARSDGEEYKLEIELEILQSEESVGNSNSRSANQQSQQGATKSDSQNFLGSSLQFIIDGDETDADTVFCVGDDLPSAVIFQPGETNLKLDLATCDDDAWEPHRDVEALIAMSEQYDVEDDTQQVVLDNDNPEIRVTLTTSKSTVHEKDDGSVTFTISARTITDNQPHNTAGFAINYSVNTGRASDNSNAPAAAATKGTDISMSGGAQYTGSVSYPSGEFTRVETSPGSGTYRWEMSKTVVVNLPNDTTDEGNESFHLAISKPSSTSGDVVLPATTTSTVVIEDDEARLTTLRAVSGPAVSLTDGTYTYASTIANSLSVSGFTVQPAFGATLKSILFTNDNPVGGTYIFRVPTSAPYQTPETHLYVGVNIITVVVVAEDGRTEQTYTLNVTRAKNSDSTLGDLDFTPAPPGGFNFVPTTESYAFTVEHSVVKTTVSATVNYQSVPGKESGSSLAITPLDDDGVLSGHQVDLDVGVNVITIVVTAEDTSTKTYTATITRKPLLIEIEPVSTTIHEGDPARFRITRSEALSWATSVTLLISDGTASVISGSPTTIWTIPINATEIVATVATTQDGVWEEHADITVNVTDLAEYNRGTNSIAVVNVKDDDIPAMQIDLTTSANSVDETGGPEIVLTITATTTRNEQPHAPAGVTVGYELENESDDTADYSTDYSGPSRIGTLQFFEFTGGPGSNTATSQTINGSQKYRATKTIALSVVDDELNEQNEVFDAKLTRNGQPNQVGLDTADHEIEIVDDEALLSSLGLTDITLAPAFSKDIFEYGATIPYEVLTTTVSPAAEFSGESYEITPLDAGGERGHQVTLGIGRTDIKVAVTSEAGTVDKTYNVAVTRGEAAVSISSVDDEVEEGENAVFRISRFVSASEDLAVNISVLGESSVITTSPLPTSVTIPSGQTYIGLTLATNDNDTWTRTLEITATLNAGDGYALAVDSDDHDSVIDVLDNDVPNLDVSVESSEGDTFSEKTGAVTLSITAETDANTKPNADFSVNVATEADTATAADDYTAIDADVEFHATDFRLTTSGGNTVYRASREVTLTIVDDTDDEESETLEVSVTTLADTPDSVDVPSGLTLTIQDDEVFLSAVTFDPAPTEFSFDAGTEAYPSILFDNQHLSTTMTSTQAVPSRTVPLSKYSPADSNALASDYQVSIPATGTQLVTVTLKAEDGTEKAYSFTLTRDTASVSISADPTTVTEGEDIIFTVTRPVAVQEALTVGLSVSDGAGDVIDGTPMTSVTIASGQSEATFTVETVDDHVWELDTEIVATVETGTGYTAPDDPATALVEDNDVFVSTVSFESLSSRITESTGTETFNLLVTTGQIPNRDFDITVTPTSDTALVGTDVTFEDYPKTFTYEPTDFVGIIPSGQTEVSYYVASKEIIFAVAEDDIDEPNEVFKVVLVNPDSNVPLTLPDDLEIEILDNEGLLTSLTLVNPDIPFVFSPNILDYTVEISNAITATHVKATPSHGAQINEKLQSASGCMVPDTAPDGCPSSAKCEFSAAGGNDQDRGRGNGRGRDFSFVFHINH